jgi:hypothetical protein
MAEKCCLDTRLFKTLEVNPRCKQIRPRTPSFFNLCSKLTQDKRKSSVAMARLKLLKSNGYKLLSWGHEATTYLCVGSLGFQELSK